MDFPLGRDLKERILGRFDSTVLEILKDLKFKDGHVDEFRDVLRSSSYATIDIFLEKMQRFRDIGSHMIALTIMPLENQLKLFPKNDWYGTPDIGFIYLYRTEKIALGGLDCRAEPMVKMPSGLLCDP